MLFDCCFNSLYLTILAAGWGQGEVIYCLILKFIVLFRIRFWMIFLLSHIHLTLDSQQYAWCLLSFSLSRWVTACTDKHWFYCWKKFHKEILGMIRWFLGTGKMVQYFALRFCPTKLFGKSSQPGRVLLFCWLAPWVHIRQYNTLFIFRIW